MKRHLLPYVLAGVLALGAGAWASLADAQPAAHPLNPPTAQEQKAARHRHGKGQIACTVSGCYRIPPECHPEMGYDINDIPTGFDIVVCPPPERRRR
jgi:hypothetical protein